MNRTRNMMGAALFTALLILSSYVTIPVGPVPVTLQTLMVLLAGFLLGPVWGPASVLVWMLLGCVGLPVFNQGQAGIVMLAGPTGGFILSFPVVAWLAGKVSRGSWAGDSLGKNFLALAGVTVVCYLIGALGFRLSFAFFLHRPMTWEKTIVLAVAPFLPLDIVKAFITAFLGIRIRRALKAGGMWE